jgi:hypothetical protein
VSLRRLRLLKGSPTAEQKSAEGIVGDAVGELVRHSNTERWSQQIGKPGTVTEGPNERSGQ